MTLDSRRVGGEATAGQKTPRRRRNRGSGKRNNSGGEGARGNMNKHGRQRNGRKSCSSLESVMSAEGSVKEGKEKGANGSHVPAVPADASKAVKSQHSDSIRGWFSSISWQERAAVCSIEDTAFVATLLDLAASSSHHHKSGTSSGTWPCTRYFCTCSLRRNVLAIEESFLLRQSHIFFTCSTRIWFQDSRQFGAPSFHWNRLRKHISRIWFRPSPCALQKQRLQSHRTIACWRRRALMPPRMCPSNRR